MNSIQTSMQLLSRLVHTGQYCRQILTFFCAGVFFAFVVIESTWKPTDFTFRRRFGNGCALRVLILSRPGQIVSLLPFPITLQNGQKLLLLETIWLQLLREFLWFVSFLDSERHTVVLSSWLWVRVRLFSQLKEWMEIDKLNYELLFLDHWLMLWQSVFAELWIPCWPNPLVSRNMIGTNVFCWCLLLSSYCT